MKIHLLPIVMILTYLTIACDEKVPDHSKDYSHINVPEFNKQKTPASSRSREAITRVAPRLVDELNEQGLTFGAPVYIRIFKEEEELELWVRSGKEFKLFKTYPIAAYSGDLGPKQKEGDRQAPEGFYYVSPTRMNPNSRFHLAFNIGYPNTYDRAHSRTGSAIMVHGNKVSIGCFAMTDSKIEEIYALTDAGLRNGQKYFRFHSFPFRMTTEKMQNHRGDKWYSFWQNLKQGYDHFEKDKVPPNTEVRNRKYVFETDKNL